MVNNVYDFISNKPEYVESLRKCYNYEKEHEGTWTSPYHGFEWSDVQVDSTRLRVMFSAGILKVTRKSRSSTAYRIVDMEAVRNALENIEHTTNAPESITIPPNLLDSIIGFDDMKDQIIRSLRLPRPVHFLFVGPPASAKSILLLELSRIPGSHYILGGSASKAGIYELLFSTNPSVLLVDEIEKVDNVRTLSVLLSLMANGIITETKFGKTREARLNTRVFAAANSLKGLSPELRSRFAEFILRPYTDEEFKTVTAKVLTTYEDKTIEIANYIANKVLTELRSHDVRDAIRVARMTTTTADVDKTIGVMKKYSDSDIFTR